MKLALILLLIIINLLGILLSNVSFKWSAMSADWKGFLRWQVVGNVTGFISVLSLTALLKLISLHQANAITVGLGFVLVQIIGARFIFHEPVSKIGWAGAGLVAVGIVLISLGR